MAGSPFFMMLMYGRYLKKFYEEHPDGDKKPLGPFLYTLRFIGKFFLFVLLPTFVIMTIILLITEGA